MNLLNRFIKYVKIDTQSDPNSNTYPSTAKQFDLLNLLKDELKEMGYLDAFVSEYGYLYLKIPANTNKKSYSIGFIAHVDTSFDAPGAFVNPRVIKDYDGSLIKLEDGLVLDPQTDQNLNKLIGHTLITTDGKTLLGADDKAGVSIIMELCEELANNKDILHGDIYICFTPDEEIGRGTDYFDYDFFKADFAYTLDGGDVSIINYENFNAATAKIVFKGVGIHPGSAKDVMINSVHLFNEFHSMLPKELDPALTEEREGFNHITSINGQVEETVVNYIIRNHDFDLFNKQKNTFEEISVFMNNKYNYKAVEVLITDSYYNMYNEVSKNMHVIKIVEKAYDNLGVNYLFEPIRGGTDGARLTENGLICPNLGTGGFNYHSRLEYASLDQMIVSLKLIKEIINLSWL